MVTVWNDLREDYLKCYITSLGIKNLECAQPEISVRTITITRPARLEASGQHWKLTILPCILAQNPHIYTASFRANTLLFPVWWSLSPY